MRSIRSTRGGLFVLACIVLSTTTVVLISACDDSQLATAGDVLTIPAEGPLFSVVGRRPVYQVTGGGSVVREGPAGPRRSVYAFNAGLDATGKASGQAEVHFTSTPAHLHIDVQCVAVRGNEAWLSGPVTRSDNPDFYLGGVFLWRVRDNGQGRAAEPDQISSFVWNPGQDYPPAACLWQPESMAMDPWTNGNVDIRGDNEDLDLAYMAGTWDATLLRYIWLEDLSDTLDVIALGARMRMTVAPNGDFTNVWWYPGEIFENTHGHMEIVNGEAVITVPEVPGFEIVARLWRVGGAVWMESDQMGHDFDGDADEDPSHVMGLSQRKTTGTLIEDLAGTWEATTWRYTSTEDPSVVLDVLADGNHSVTLTVTLDSRLYFVIEPEGWTSNTVEVLIQGDMILTRDGSESESVVFSLEDDTLSFSGFQEVDFDGDGTQDPANLEAVLVRQ
jgi:hypothetical protein